MESVIVKCPRCGKNLECVVGESRICPNCGCKIREELIKSAYSEYQSRIKSNKNRKKTKGLAVAIIAIGIEVGILLLFLLSKCDLISVTDGEHCVICGKDAIYTTPDGQGLCSEHVLDLLSRDEKER